MNNQWTTERPALLKNEIFAKKSIDTINKALSLLIFRFKAEKGIDRVAMSQQDFDDVLKKIRTELKLIEAHGKDSTKFSIWD